MNISITGYCGTGSSALISLLEEYKSCSSGKCGHYEHVPFYTPNGLFDLEYKLLYENNFHRSDEAIDSFLKEMKRLDEGEWNWFARLHYIFGDEFEKITRQFIDELHGYSFDGYWSYDYIGTKFTLKGILKDLYLKHFKHVKFQRSIGIRPVLTKDNVIKAAFPTEEEFFSAARKYVDAYMALFHDKTPNTIYDHLILPHNAHKIPQYFGDDFRAIIVDRDVRDMYILTKYVWPYMGFQAQYPKDVDSFIDFWGRLRRLEKPVDDKRVMRIYFEELIYDYDNCVKKIEEFLGLSAKDHTEIKQKFQPERSIDNTQNFLIKPEWEEEVRILEERFPEFIYHFPYRRVTKIENTFNS